MIRTIAAAGLLFVVASTVAARGAEPVAEHKLRIKVDLGDDVGQNYGTLLTITDRNGREVGGAGFEGVYNTTGRGNRRRLQVFLKPQGDTPEPVVKPLPRSTTDAGVYLSDFDGKLYAQSAFGGKDRRFRGWDGAKWTTDEVNVPYATYVAGKVLAVVTPQVLYDGRPILDLTGSGATIAHYYYATGHLFVRLTGEGINEIAACRWQPSQIEPIDYQAAEKIELRTPREFIYAFGQWHDHVLAATNTGGVYRFDGKAWTCLVEPIMEVSYQIYTIINYYDRLLMGQYPTGNLFEYDGKAVRHLADQPPVMPGVSDRAREAQTSAIYGGDLYVGVWPWAELWRLDGETQHWQLTRRMFTHPELTDKQVHPYEQEATQLGHVLNRWGQRITGLVPLGDSLFVGTSSKGSAPYERQFEFLNPQDRWQDYGRIYQLTLPGQASLDVAWKSGPITFDVTVTDKRLSVSQDGGPPQHATITPAMSRAWTTGTLKTRSGVFGPFRGKSVSVTPDGQ